MKNNEKAIDCLILDMFKKDPFCNLTYMSQKLRLPKTEIMKRLEYLSKNNYLSFKDNGFYPTHSGCDIAVTPNDISSFHNTDSEENVQTEFDWENCDYIPTLESFLRKKAE